MLSYILDSSGFTLLHESLPSVTIQSLYSFLRLIVNVLRRIREIPHPTHSIISFPIMDDRAILSTALSRIAHVTTRNDLLMRNLEDLGASLNTVILHYRFSHEDQQRFWFDLLNFFGERKENGISAQNIMKENEMHFHAIRKKLCEKCPVCQNGAQSESFDFKRHDAEMEYYREERWRITRRERQCMTELDWSKDLLGRLT